MLFDSIQPQSPRKRLMALAVSAVLHLCLATALIVVPLVFYKSLPEMEVLTFLVQPPEPPPPPPPPPPPAPAFQPKTVIAQYSVPTEIPKSIPPPDADTPPAVDPKLVSSLAVGIPGGVPGGVPGGSLSGIIGGIVGKQQALPPLPKPVETPPPKPKPIFVGGDIQAAKLIRGEPAVYPDLALKAHVAGVVLLRVTVDEEGKVSDIKVISGHPLLVPAAVHAVSHWIYRPTLLNGQPVPVIATVAVNFTLQ